MKLLNLRHWQLALLFTVPIAVSAGVVFYVFGLPEQTPLNRLALAAGLVGIIAFFLSIWLAKIISRRTFDSLHPLSQAMLHIAQGNLDYRLQAGNEPKELIDAFNQTAATLRNTIEELSEERNKLSAVLDTMADGVVVIEADGRIELMNRAGEDILNANAVTAVGSRFMEAVRDHEIRDVISKALQTKQPQRGDIELLQRRRYLVAIAAPLTQEETSGVLLTLHDLTPIRQLETTRREFVSNVSHELRTPIASIKAMVETLQRGAMEDRQVAVDFMERIDRDIVRMNDIVSELLELSLLESGQMKLDVSSIDVIPFLEEIRQEYQAKAEAKKIRLTVEEDAHRLRVIGDRGKVRQVLANLLDNALKATAESGEIGLSAEAQTGSTRISVWDTGAGIAQEHLPHIFERFYKVDRSRRDGGTGLGLAIVKHLVQAQDGEVWVESREGEGSTFSFTLPAAR